MKHSSCRAVVQLLTGLALSSAAVSPAHAQDHLVLSEVVLAPSAGEFIEVYNPTASTISLDHYYLADNAYYAVLPAGSPAPDVGDFIVRFPVGASITPGQVVVVAMSGTGFATTYAGTPQFEIIGDDAGVTDMVVVAVNSLPSLTNSGEGIALFYWDGQSDLVKDVDLMNVGVPTLANRIANKNGISIDGPDPDAIPSAYATDSYFLPLQLSAPAAGFSTKRIALEDDEESWAGGNGITGHDETSENTAVTWDQVYTAPDPGSVHVVAAVGGPAGVAGPVRIFPNPSTGAVTIDFANAASTPTSRVSIYSVTGERVYSGGAGATGGAIALRLRPGLYWVHVSGGRSSATRKLVVLGR